MKKLLWVLLIVFSMVALASCGVDDTGNTGNEGDNTSTFDPNNVTMLSAYSQAQALIISINSSRVPEKPSACA